MGKERRHTPDTTVGPQAALIGHMDTDQPLRIYGIFEGDLKVTNTVFIDKEGLVNANVTADHVIVQGVVIGNVCAERVEIRASGKVWGNVCAQSFCVESGGFIRGQVIISHQTEHQLNTRFLESLADPIVPPLQPLYDDDLDHLSAEPEEIAQKASAVDGLLISPQPVHSKESLIRVAEAKNWTSFPLQLGLQAVRQALAEQEALVATLSTNMAHTGSERETALVQQNTELRDELERSRVTASQHQQSLTELPVELDETRLALEAAQDEISHLNTNLTEVNAQLQSLSDELARSQARYDHLVAETTKASEQLHRQLAEVKAKWDRAAAKLDAAPAEKKEVGIARLQADPKTSRNQVEQQQQVHIAYCLTCHGQRPMADVREIVMPDGRRTVKGRCTACGASLLSLIPSN